MTVEYDVVVIGGGSGGLVVASFMAQSNAKVALVEKNRLGGDCLWHGCVPSKSLIHAGRVAHDVKTGARFGVHTVAPPSINFAEALGHVHRAIAAIEPHDSPERFRGLGVDVIFGSGQFISDRVFEVDGHQLTARNFVIATGSRPSLPPIPGLQETGFITNEQIFHLETRPGSLAVIGAGPIGCELGQAMHRLGADVTILASKGQILPKEDPEAAAVVAAQLEADGLKILRQTRAEKVELINGKKYITTTAGKVMVDEILVAAGRTPNVESLNLETAGVTYDAKGVKVNAKLQTSNPRIYACGDIIGGYQFTHVAGYEAVVVSFNLLKNALFLPGGAADYRVIPWATFTEPELARVGMSEAQAQARYGDDVVVLKQDFLNVDRAQAEGATEGFMKLIVRNNGEILGAHLVGSSAGELIHEVVLAMSQKLKVSALSGIHIYPTLSEVNSKAALQLSKQKVAKNQLLKTFLRQLFNFRREV